MPVYPFVQCRWRTPTTGRRVDLIVLHTAETPEGVNTAQAVARYFATTNVKASAHYCVDGGGHIVQTCREVDVAYAAPGANHNGVHLELAGRAAQSGVEWHDSYSWNLLKTAAPLVADLCAHYKLPIRYVPAAQLVAGGPGARGITTHADVSEAYKKSTHWDPGPNFPIVEFVNLVLGGAATATPPRLQRIDSLEVDVVINTFTLAVTTDNEGRGWDKVPFPRSRIIGYTAPGIRPGVDGRYVTGEVGFADEDSGTVVSLTEWEPNSHAVVTLSVVN